MAVTKKASRSKGRLLSNINMGQNKPASGEFLQTKRFGGIITHITYFPEKEN